MSDGFDLSGFLAAFFDEARERLGAIHERLAKLERGELDEEEMVALRRDAHTIKGSALMLGVQDVGETAHVFEDAMDHLLRHPEARDEAFVRFLFRLHDLLDERVRDPDGASAIEVAPLREELARLVEAGAAAGADAPEEGAEEPEALIGADEAAAAQRRASSQEAVEEPSGKDGAAPSAFRPAVESSRPAAAAERRASGRFLRVDAERIEELGHRFTEFVAMRGRMDFALGGLERGLRRLHGHLQLLRTLARAHPELADALARAGREAAEALHGMRRAAGELASEKAREDRVLEEMREEIFRLQMRPLAGVFSMFPRAVREVAAKEGKRVRLVMQGEDLLVDRDAAEALVEPLVHLLTNAVIHGIEPPEERRRLGKPEEGQLAVIARQEGNEVRIEVVDDGRGIDEEQVRRAAVARGVTTEAELAAMSRAEVLELIFRPGFTTRKEAGQLAGRGIGLNAVQSAVRKRMGAIRIETERGRGTRFVITLPTHSAVQQVLLFRIGGMTLGMLAHLVDHVAPFEEDMVATDERGRPAIRYRGRLAPLLDLRGFVGGDTEGGRAFVVFAEHLEGFVGVVVDELVGEPELVVHDLDPYLKRYQVPAVMGLVILPAGEVVFLLDPQGVMEMARTSPDVRLQKAALAAEEEAALPAVAGMRALLVDDSVIAREVERRMLAAAGLVVDVAIDGQDALEKVRVHRPDFVVTDIEMPRLDGFGLTRRLRAMQETREVPILVISTRESDEDRRRALEAGADRYLVKQKLTPEGLREALEELLARRGADSTAG